MKIREVGQNDINEITKMYIELDNLHFKALPEKFFTSDVVDRNEEIINLLGKENIILLVAEDKKSLCGFIQVSIKERIDPIIRNKKYGWLDVVFIKEQYRKKGVGKKLLETALIKLKTYNINNLELNVWEFNQNAINFYISQGFTSICRKMNIDIWLLFSLILDK